MNKFPCNECIVLGVCKSAVFKDRLTNIPSLGNLLDRCDLLEQYFNDNVWNLPPGKQADINRSELLVQFYSIFSKFPDPQIEEILDSLRNKYD